MKKILLLACVAGLGLSACNKKSNCPAYSGIKDANRLSSPVMAQAPTAAPDRQ
ncbi:hypothetical protein [Hymenobacter psychrophilus]|uniref:Lipoprotein n=1 Tax=Hymenobacter psychrophilus TaxID=651662 RepID=A0A1H3IM79_9BACT|nr:hypothetical protein [Hymenobacter psychrophilus]SDY28943.1 hypothetical protein SAMN04488069_10780 [Hymenobacter psychrophilus]